ncbi:MAG: hypothetical protein WD669_05675 [Pirellulales bacterium]
MRFTLFENLFTISSILLNTAGFACLQCVALRTIRPLRLLVFSGLVFAGETLIFLALVYLTCNDLFASFRSFLNYGVIVAVGSVGLCGLYTFLGPATADRSATAQMLSFLLRSGTSRPSFALLAAFDADRFLQKRLSECRQAKLIGAESETITLTRRGHVLAKAYDWMTRCCRLENLPGYIYAFRH